MADQALMISVRADTSQLRGDLAIANAQVSAFGQQLRAAAKESLVSGDTSTVATLAGQFEGAVTHAKALKAEIALGAAEVSNFAKRLDEASPRVRSLIGQFQGGLAGILSGGGLGGPELAVAGVVGALGAVVHLATGAAEHAHEITMFAAAIGSSTGQVRAWMKAAADAGVSEELFTQTIERQTIAAEKASEALRKNAIEGAKIMAPEVTGGAVRGGMNQKVPPPTSQMIDVGASFMKDTEQNRVAALSSYSQLEKAQEKLKNDGATPPPLMGWEAFFAKLRQDAMKTTAEGLKLRDTITKAGGVVPAKSLSEELARMEPGFLDPFTKIGVHVTDLVGKLREMDGVLDDIKTKLKDLPAAEALAWEVQTGGRGARDPNLVSFMKEGPPGGFGAGKGQDADIKAADDAWKAAVKTVEDLKEAGFQTGLAVDNTAMSLGKYVDEANKASDIFFTLDMGLSNFEKLTGAAATGIASAVETVASALGKLPGPSQDGLPGGLFPAPGNAMGGLIRGPGTGTSDSIHALVSNGEYIVPARAVPANLGLLDAMSGGFSAPRFALGGPVGFAAGAGGGGGTTHVLNLTIGNQTVAIPTDAHILGAVERAARGADMLSAGRRPGWNGG
jgi:hypothetical protein